MTSSSFFAIEAQLSSCCDVQTDKMIMRNILYGTICLLSRSFGLSRLCMIPICEAFVHRGFARVSLAKYEKISVSSSSSSSSPVRMASSDEEKFGFSQRIDSLKSFVVGALSGSIAAVPFLALHDLVLIPPEVTTDALSQWEFDNDMAAAQTGLFAIVYRYCVRQDNNDQLGQGVIAAFVVIRTLSRVVVSASCSAITLDCKCAARLKPGCSDARVLFSQYDWFCFLQVGLSWVTLIGTCWASWLQTASSRSSCLVPQPPLWIGY